MKVYRFECRLLADVVITADTASEGIRESLDYIPGSKFLGIASRLYDMSQVTKTLDLFHNGTVRFGDAYPVLNGERAYRIPFSWLLKKGDSVSDGIYLHHQVVDKELKGVQLKQKRKGYVSAKGDVLNEIPQLFSIKSAYDLTARRAKDSQMYGYFALPKGTLWTFDVEDDSGRYIEELKSLLVGRHRIGRSRSAQYGLIEISSPSKVNLHENEVIEDNVLLYAASNLLFYDDYGVSIVKPDPVKHLGLPEGSIVNWAKSQVRSRLYQTWNRYRHNRDADRQIIERGSVFHCTIPKGFPIKSSMTIGSGRSEGFGKVLVDPEFLVNAKSGSSAQLNLQIQTITLEEWQSLANKKPVVEPSEEDRKLLSLLRLRQDRSNKEITIDEVVNQFINSHYEDYKGVSPSQWGMVRNYAKQATKPDVLRKLLFEKQETADSRMNFGCLLRGKSEATWRRKNRRGRLEEVLFKQNHGQDPIQLAIRIASEMPKFTKSH